MRKERKEDAKVAKKFFAQNQKTFRSRSDHKSLRPLRSFRRPLRNPGDGTGGLATCAERLAELEGAAVLGDGFEEAGARGRVADLGRTQEERVARGEGRGP